MICSPTAFEPVNDDERDVGVLDERAPDVLADAGEEREHTGWHARLVQDLDEPQRDRRASARRA